MASSLMLMLEAIGQEQAQHTTQPCTLNFSFDPHSIGPYGFKESLWQATFVKDGLATTDYGATLAEAAQRLLDRLQHPANYPMPTDD